MGLLDEFLTLQVLEFISVGQAFLYLAMFIIADAIFGIILSIKNSEFEVAKLPQFLQGNVFPYLGGVIILSGVAHISGAFGGKLFVPVFLTLAGIVAAKFFVETILKALKLFGLFDRQ